VKTPTTFGAFQTTFAGGPSNAIVTKLNAAGSALVYSTYLSGSGGDNGLGIAVDSAGSAYVTGVTNGNFPTTPGAFQTTFSGGPNDAFVAKLNATGSALVYSTYLGGSGNEEGSSIAVDSVGSAYVTGATSSTDFPTTAGAFQMTFGGGSGDAFVTKLNAAGSALLYSTYLGGNGLVLDTGSAIAVDSAGSAYVTGFTDSTNFPTTSGAFQTTFGGGVNDAFVAKITDFAFLGSGSFVIGDLNAAVGSPVTFWGAQWAKVNSLSGGPAPNSFKGFADTAPQTCGGSWTSRPGNSSNPPDSVPPFMAVIASSSITKSGATISGDVPKIVIVKTNPGYGPSPGHTGTGTVVAVLCAS